MTYDFNQLFAGFQLPAATRPRPWFAEAASAAQLAAKSQKAAEE